MKQRNWRALWSVLLSLLLCVQLTAPAFASQSGAAARSEQICIGTAQEFQELARACALDTWSQNMTVTLTGDISLADVKVPSIPSFGGVFDGGGHTISGVSLSGGVSPMGLFGTLQPGGVVKNLHVRGSIAPAGTRDVAGGLAGVNSGLIENCTFTGTVAGGSSVGGLVGVNEVTGIIRDSAAAGSITGKSMTGGIAGKNLGVISGCRNSARVNITSVDPSLDLSELDLGASANLRSWNALDTVNVATDTGGIAGYSTGMILSCTNQAVIGYQHIGYNVGGIAGRSCGHIANCENSGAVLGRKDVGGIVGQAEPYIVLSLSASQVDTLRGNLDRLQELVEAALDNAEASGDQLSDRFSAVGSAVDGAASYAEELGRQLSRFGDSATTEINRGSAVLADAISRLNGMSGDLTTLSGTFSEGLGGLGAALEELSETEALSQSADELLAASEALRGASEPVKNGIKQINSGVDALQAAITVKDTGKIQAAGKHLSTGLSGLADSAGAVSGAFQALSDSLNAAGELDSAVGAARDLAAACAEMANGLRQLGAGFQALADSFVIEDQAAVEAALRQLREGARTCAHAASDASKAAGDLLQALQNGDSSGADAAMEKLQTANGQLSGGMDQVDAALTVLEQNISVDDEKAQAALGTMRTGLDVLTQGADQAAKALDALNAALDAADVDRALEALGDLSGGVAQMSNALKQLSGGIKTIQDNLTVDTGAVSEGIDAVQAGVDTLLTAVDAMDRGLAELEKALKSLQEVTGQLGGALGSLADAAQHFQAASDQGTGVLRQVESLFDYLSGVDPIQITYPSGEIDAAASGLFGTMDQLSGELRALNSQAGDLSDSLTGDLRAVSAQLQLTMNGLLDAIDEAENRTGQELVSDTSEENIDAVTSGKILSSTNYGEVRGDINVGGVAGAMAVEYELDPEDDLSDGSPVYRREYELKAILQKCANHGAVTSLRDYAGGICGRSDLGLVTRCEGCGTITSESGDYVGGIAGFSGGTIQDSFAKCRLSGGDYVGGITGAASDGTVIRCYSLVRVTDHGQYTGAISGSGQGTFQDNYFVSDTLAGLDQVSLSGKAQVIGYSQLLQVEGLPEAFKSFTLRFLAGDGTEAETAPRIVKKLTFHYGDSFGGDIFPDIPPQEGCFSTWDRTDLTDLRFDTDVTAVYTPYITALAGGGRRDDGRPVFLAEGQFSGEDEFTATPAQLPQDRTAVLSGLTFLSRRTLLETWTLEGDAHTIRYLSPTGNGEDLELYLLESAGWVRLETRSAGSYLLAGVSGSPATVAVVSRTSVWWILILTAVLALAALGLFCLLLVRRRRGRKRAAKGQPDTGKTAPAGTVRRRRRLAVLFAAAIVLALGVVIFFATGLKDDAAAWALLKRYTGRDELTARLTAEVQAGEQRHYIDTLITRARVEGKQVTCAEQYGGKVYYCDSLIYLENGQAVEAGHLIPNYPDLLSGVFALYRGSDITVFDNPSERIYSVSVDGDAALSLLADMLPSALGRLARVDRLEVGLVEQGGELAELRLKAGGLFAGDSAELPLTVSAVLKTQSGNSQAVELPSRVRQQIVSGTGTAPMAGEDALRLMESWLKLTVRDPLVSDVALSADCGSLVLDEELVWSRTHTSGVEVNSIRKNGRTWYFSKENVYDESGNRDSTAGPALFSPRDLLKLAYQLCINSEISCEENAGTYTYTLTLDQDGMAQVAHTVLPDSEKLALSLQSGSVRIMVTDGEVESIRFACEGGVRIAVVDAPVSMDAELRFRSPSGETEAEIPGDVLTELSRPGG